MLRGDESQDRKITLAVSTHLMGRGIRSPCHVRVTTHAGEVTLAGEVQYEHQKALAMDVAKHVPGVRRVIDQVRVLPRVDIWKTPARPPGSMAHSPTTTPADHRVLPPEQRTASAPTEPAPGVTPTVRPQ